MDVHVSIFGEDDAHVVFHSFERDGQNARHIGQTAGLAEGDRLAGGEEDLH
jgi:hypothetical protein